MYSCRLRHKVNQREVHGRVYLMAAYYRPSPHTLQNIPHTPPPTLYPITLPLSLPPGLPLPSFSIRSLIPLFPRPISSPLSPSLSPSPPLSSLYLPSSRSPSLRFSLFLSHSLPPLSLSCLTSPNPPLPSPSSLPLAPLHHHQSRVAVDHHGISR